MLGVPALAMSASARPVTVTPRVLPGPATADAAEQRLHVQRGGLQALEGIDWGPGRMVVYGQGSVVLVADPGSTQHVTALDAHRAGVTAVRLLSGRSGEIRVASGDSLGVVHVWDLLSGRAVNTFHCHDGSLPKESRDLGRQSCAAVLALRQTPPPALPEGSQQKGQLQVISMTALYLVLYDVGAGTERWRMKLGREACLVSMSLSSRGDCLLCTDDGGLRVIADVGASKPPSRATAMNASEHGELQHAVWCPAGRTLALLVTRHEVLLYDVRLKRVVDSLRLAAARAEFRGVLVAPGFSAAAESVLLGSPGALPIYTLHADGSVAAWMRRDTESAVELLASSTPFAASQPAVAASVSTQMDLRIGKSGHGGRPCFVAVERVGGAAAAVGSATLTARFASVANDGSLAVWEHHHGEGLYRLRGVCPATPDRVQQMCMASLDLHRSAGSSPRSDTTSTAGLCTCICVTTASGLLIAYDAMTGDIVFRVEVCSERGTTTCALKPLGRSGVLVGATKQGQGGGYHNVLLIVTVPATRLECLRDGRNLEQQNLLSAEVSSSAKLLAAVFASGCVEVWDIPGKWLLQRFNYPSLVLLRWMPQHYTTAGGGEMCMWVSCVDGLVSFFRVRDDNGTFKIREYTRDNPSFVQPRTRVMIGFGYPAAAADWYDEILLSGDASGMLHIIKVTAAVYSQVNETPRANIVQISVCPRRYCAGMSTGSPSSGRQGSRRGSPQQRPIFLAIILYADENFAVYDIGKSHKISTSEGRDLRAVAAGWARGPHPVIATPQGSVLVLDLTLNASGGSVYLRSLARPLRTMALLPQPHSAFLSACLCMGVLSMVAAEGSDQSPRGASQLLEFTQAGRLHRNAYGELIGSDVSTHADEVQLHLQLIEPAVLANLRATLDDGVLGGGDVAARCCTVAAVFADQGRMQFWQVASRALAKAESERRGHVRERFVHPGSLASKQAKVDMLLARKTAAAHADEHDDLGDGSDAGEYYDGEDDMLADDTLRHAAALSSTAALERCARSHNQGRFFSGIAASHVRLGQLPRAVRLLLETPSDSPDFKANMFKACVVAAAESPIQLQHTARRVASLLMNADDTDGAVELLCLTGKGVLACQELQSAGRHDEAALLAKTTLDAPDAAVVLRGCAEATLQTGDVLLAAAIVVQTGDFVRAMSILEAHPEMSDVAALLGLAAHSRGVLSTDKDSVAVATRAFDTYSDMLSSLQAATLATRFAELSAALRAQAEAGADEAESGKPVEAVLL